MIFDPFGRSFTKLRISLTNTCNFSCVYCVSDEEAKNTYKSNLENQLGRGIPLQLADYLKIVRVLHSKLNLKAIKITGGEPLLFKGIETLISGIKEIGINEISLTTNGHLLKQKSKALKMAGLSAINVSLDALENEKFKLVTRNGHLKPVLDGIDQCIEDGHLIKLNSVIMRGINEDQVLPLLDFALDKNIVLRYIELMKMGPLQETTHQTFFSAQSILDLIQSKYLIQKLIKPLNDTTNYWTINKGKSFGIIANESIPFCSDCNRLRLDSFGSLYGCLSNLIGISINDILNDSSKMDNALSLAMSHKQSVKFNGNEKTMKSIGG